MSVLRRSEQLLGKDNSSIIAQYYCETAELAAELARCSQMIGVALQPVEEIAVADERHLDRLGHSGNAVACLQGVDEIHVIDHRERRREGADEVLLTVQVDTVLDADAGVVLREHRGRHAHVSHTAMGRRRHQTDGIEHRAATDDRQNRLHPGLTGVIERIDQPREEFLFRGSSIHRI